MRIDVFTLFPECFASPLQSSMLKRAMDRGIVDVHIHNIRDSATDKHKVCDDYPYGGGAGMIMKPEPLFAAVESVLGDQMAQDEVPVILMSPQGRLFSDAVARELASQPRIAIICGHYEGVDERVREHLCNDEISIGDYVVTGGELPALVLLDAVMRLLPGALGDDTSSTTESHVNGLLEYPHFTRPAEFRGFKVPEVLLSGHHAEIARWRRHESLRRTLDRRPDLLNKAHLSEEDRDYLQSLTKLH